MPYYRVNRIGCGGMITRIVLVVMLGIVVLVCIANRTWLTKQAVDAIYGDRPEIHTGQYFTPGASAVEDGVRQTAVRIHGVPHVRVTSPSHQWRSAHKDATCDHDVCTARATAGSFIGEGGFDLVGLGAVLLMGYFVWLLLFYDDRDYEGFRRFLNQPRW